MLDRLARCALPAGALLGLVALVAPRLAVAESAPAPTSYVIAPGNEKLFLEMTDPKPGKFAGAWALDAVAIRQSKAVLTYVDAKGGKAQLALGHPSSAGAAGSVALGSTGRFALLQEGGAAAPKPLVEAVAARVRSKESAFSWTAIAIEAPKAPGPNQGWPTIPDDAVTAERLKRLEYPLPGANEVADRAELAKAVEQAKVGKSDVARAAARTLADKYPGALWPAVAAAMVLRASGDGGGAAMMLAPLVGKGPSDAESDRLRLELAASQLLAKQGAEADKTLASLKSPPEGGAGCGRAQAFTLLVQEGRAHDVLQLAGGDLKGEPRCMLQMRIRAAIAANDKGALDSAGEAAVKANPRDENLLYLWGSYYYDHQDFPGALKAWDRLADVNPNYPGFLGLYGTTYHVLGLLKGETLAKYLKRAKDSPEDVIGNHLGGIGLYYDRKYAEVIPLLERVLKKNDEPRAGMYLAMSHFFTGDVDGAIKMLDALEPVAHREPDIYYCRSLVWRFYDLNRAIKEMQVFLDVFLSENRPAYGQQKIEKAKDDLARMKKGEVPSVYLAGQGTYTPPPRKSSK